MLLLAELFLLPCLPALSLSPRLISGFLYLGITFSITRTSSSSIPQEFHWPPHSTKPSLFPCHFVSVFYHSILPLMTLDWLLTSTINSLWNLHGVDLHFTDMETEAQGNYVTKNKVKFLVTHPHTPEGPHQHFIVPSSSKEKLLAPITQLGMRTWHYVCVRGPGWAPNAMLHNAILHATGLRMEGPGPVHPGSRASQLFS